MAGDAIASVEAFQTLPERNQKLVLDMASFAIKRANDTDDRWKQNFWGLYVVGSRARGEARPDSDLDLLSVGTFYRAQGFIDFLREDIFEGFELEIPVELPDEYNIGDVDRKYLVRATPTVEEVLPVDLSVVDLTFWRGTLDTFKETMDIAEDGSELARLPLFELSVPEERFAFRY
jgi:predicted nucleotidyltransferase